jgi:hypothetical protein
MFLYLHDLFTTWALVPQTIGHFQLLFCWSNDALFCSFIPRHFFLSSNSVPNSFYAIHLKELVTKTFAFYNRNYKYTEFLKKATVIHSVCLVFCLSKTYNKFWSQSYFLNQFKPFFAPQSAVSTWHNINPSVLIDLRVSLFL